jgi:hypothetical protein
VTIFAALALILAVAVAIAWPLSKAPDFAADSAAGREQAELLEHEKNIALLAIKEAEFDRAMGKLSEGDYSTLRSEYEDRALTALSALDVLPHKSGDPPDDGTLVRYCSACGQRFEIDDRFCAGCGSGRREVAARESPRRHS